MEVRRSPRKKSPSPAPVYKIPSGSSSDSSEEEAQEKADKNFKPSHSFKPSHEVRRSPRKKSPSPSPIYKIPSGSSSDSSEEESQEKMDKDFKPSHSFKPSHPEVRRSPRKKSPSPSPIYNISSGSSSDSSEEEAQEKSHKDFKPSHSYKPNHPEASSSCSSASSTPKKKRRRKESPVEETVRSESEDGSRSETELNLQSNLSGVPRKRKHAKSKRPSKLGNRKARWRQGLPEVVVRDYDHSMVKGFLKQVSALQQRHFCEESWDADDISSDDDDADGDDNSPLREEEEDFSDARVVPSETFIERLQRET
ncbi:uncharacterized protein LOC144916760 [Branchiostoma floridae x Branchiostoma belcheri]